MPYPPGGSRLLAGLGLVAVDLRPAGTAADLRRLDSRPPCARAACKWLEAMTAYACVQYRFQRTAFRRLVSTECGRAGREEDGSTAGAAA